MSDLISREEVLNLIDTAFETGAFDGRYAYENLVDAVQNVPSVEPERKTGKWQEVYAETEYQYGWIEFTCENCGHQHGLESGEYDWHFGDPIPWKYCPICGAKMEVDG